jgi:ParB family chromosome partitioning protein
MNKPARRNLATFSLRNQEKGNFQEIPLGSIILPAYQPRQYFDEEKLSELAETIKEHGILEPLLVRIVDEQFELVAGGRRYRAAQLAGLISAPAIVKELTEQEALEIALLENLQREDLNPVEETEGILKLLASRLSIMVEDVPSLLYRLQKELKGKATDNVIGQQEQQIIFDTLSNLMTFESFMTNRLRLLTLPDEILEALKEGKLAYTKAIAIAKVKDSDSRQQLLDEAIEHSLSLAEIKERIKKLQPSSPQSDLKSRFNTATQQLNKTKSLWENPKQLRKLEKLLVQIENLLSENNL